MKKISFLLSMVAFVLAIGGAVASTLLPNSVAYEFIADPEEPECRPHFIECQTETTMVSCQISGGPVLRLNDTSTTCGQELWKVVQ